MQAYTEDPGWTTPIAPLTTLLMWIKLGIYILLLSLGEDICWWFIRPREYHPPNSRCL